MKEWLIKSDQTESHGKFGVRNPASGKTGRSVGQRYSWYETLTLFAGKIAYSGRDGLSGTNGDGALFNVSPLIKDKKKNYNFTTLLNGQHFQFILAYSKYINIEENKLMYTTTKKYGLQYKLGYAFITYVILY